MLLQWVLEEYFGHVFLSRPFLVPRRDRQDPCLVVDLSALNSHIECHHFRMVTLKQVRETLLPHSWLTSLDLANAYWHVPIGPRFRSYLAVQNCSRVLCFTVLPFGLNIGSRVFTKIMKTLASMLADVNIRIMYLDDWLVQGSSREEAQAATTRTVSISEFLGFHFNFPKSRLEPTQDLQWLGMWWDTQISTIRLSEDNRRRVLQRVRRASWSTTFTHCMWTRLMGSLTFAA
ncbi:Protein P [Portunus trituberculatus]|uniref:Protein P n=1 Tax=Portunus trituberculatus TaxID=210409 RepID=A0A5B7GTV7_PORTR|nr:Protein P [Portunus trituberculatus]